MANSAAKSFQLLEAKVGPCPKVNWARRARLMSTLDRRASPTKPVECRELALTREASTMSASVPWAESTVLIGMVMSECRSGLSLFWACS